MKTKILATLAVLSLLGIAILGLRHIKNLDNQIQLKQIQLKDNSARLKLLDSKYIELNKELEAKDVDKAKVEQQLKDLQIERDKLQADLQAKKEQKAKDLAVRTTQAVGAPQTAQAASGNCQSWMAQAGVPNSTAANELIRRESGCNPYAVNKSSGACGIPQNINGCTTYDPVEQLKWMQSYIVRRYSTWENAVAFHNLHNWY